MKHGEGGGHMPPVPPPGSYAYEYLGNGEQGMKGKWVERGRGGGGGGGGEDGGWRRGEGEREHSPTLSEVTTTLFVILISTLSFFIDT